MKDLFYSLISNSEEANADGLSYDLGFCKNGIAELHRLDVEREYRWQGVATRFMKKLASIADECGVTLELEVGSGTDDEDIIHDLPGFYSRFGFEWQDGFMRREPR